MLSLANLGRWAKRKEIILLLLIILIGAILRVYDLGAESIWYDEASSINLSVQSVASIIQEAAPTQNHPPLYFIILHYWLGFFGTSEAAVRSLSAIFGIISIVLIYQVGSILFNRKVGLISGFISAISYFHIHYSQEARSYALLLLLSLLSYFFFIKIIKQDRKWYYPCYFLTNVLLGYTHFYGLFIIASQALFFLLFWGKYRPQRVKFLSTMAVTIVALLPLISLLGRQAKALAEGGFWIPEPGLIDILRSLTAFAGFWSSEAPKLIILAFLFLAVTGLFSIKVTEGRWNWRKPLESLQGLTWSIKPGAVEVELLLIMWLSFSILIPFIQSKLMTPIYQTRYMIGASPALYLLVAKGMGNLTMKRIFYPVLIFIILLSSLGLQQYYAYDVKEQWREATKFVELNSRVDSDVVVFYSPIGQEPFDYYHKGELQRIGVPRGIRETQEMATFIDNAVREKDRLWLILAHGGEEAPIRPYLEDRYGSEAILLEQQFKGILVILFDLSAQYARDR